MDYLGWFSLSPAEQWDTALKIVGSVAVVVIAWITSRQWKLSKIIEIETELLKNISTTTAYWYQIMKKPDISEDDMKVAKEFLEEFNLVRNEVTEGKMDLKMLRAKNREYHARAAFSNKLNELMVALQK